MAYRILSLYYGHDANLCLLEDGRPVLVLEKERATRIKHDQGHMDDLLPGLLKQHGWTPESIDLIVVNPAGRPTLDGETFRWDVRGRVYIQNPEYRQPAWSGDRPSVSRRPGGSTGRA